MLEELALVPLLVVEEFQLEQLVADHMDTADVADTVVLVACMVDWDLVASGLEDILVQDMESSSSEAVR